MPPWGHKQAQERHVALAATETALQESSMAAAAEQRLEAMQSYYVALAAVGAETA